MSTSVKLTLGIVVAAFLSCGGGSTQNWPPLPDVLDDTGDVIVDTRDAAGQDLKNDKDSNPGQDLDVRPSGDDGINHDTNPGLDDGAVADDGNVASETLDASGETTGGDADIAVDAGDIGHPFPYTCDESNNKHQVCGLDKKTTYANGTCALCGQCASVKGYDSCPCCTGDIENCDWDDDSTYIYQHAPCNECKCKTEESHTGPVCGACTSDNPDTDCGNIMGVGSAQTYENVCAFRQAMSVKFGECLDDPTTSEHFFNNGACQFSVCTACEGKAMDPVCGADGNTYPNRCWMAHCPQGGNTTRLACAAPCLDTQKCPDCAGSKCGEVCASIEQNGKIVSNSYFNECAAQCAGAQVRYHQHCIVSCQNQPYAPVCAQEADQAVTLLNDCELTQTGLTKLYDGPCKCNCAQGDCTCSCDQDGNCSCDCSGATNGVCGGQYGSTWPSECWLTCLGLDKKHDGVCTHECESCSTDFTPVCAKTADGKLKTFPNECYAECKGATKLADGVCNTCKNLCGTADNPVDSPHQVCGADGVTYPTTCFPNNCTKVQYTEGACGD